MTTSNSFGTRARLAVAGRSFEIFRLEALDKHGFAIGRLPYSLRILLENLLRLEDGRTVRREDIERLARWDPQKVPDDEIAFMPARVLMQDFTGVPAVVDLAAMRDAMQAMGGDPTLVNPLLPAELVIDHSVIVDEFGTPTAFQVNADLEFQRNRERYALLRWAQQTVVGFRLTGKLAEGATATDLVLTVTEMLRKRGVVGKFVEFYGPGIATLPLADRATIGNMAPEYGATVGIFPVDQETLRYLEFTGRTKEQVALVAAYMQEQGLFHTPDAPEPVYSDTLSLDLSTVEPSLAGPRRPQDRVPLRTVGRAFLDALPTLVKPSSPIAPPADGRNHWGAEGGQAFGGGP